MPRPFEDAETEATSKLMLVSLCSLDLAIDFALGDLGMGTFSSLFTSEMLKYAGLSKLLLRSCGVDCDAIVKDRDDWRLRRQRGEEVNFSLRAERLARERLIARLRNLEESKEHNIPQKVLVPGLKVLEPKRNAAACAFYDDNDRAMIAAGS